MSRDIVCLFQEFVAKATYSRETNEGYLRNTAHRDEFPETF